MKSSTTGNERPMRIAVVHSYYSSRQPSGENVVVDLQLDTLRARGHIVRAVTQHTDEREIERLYGVRAAATVASGHGPDPLAELADFRPDVVHVHNLFPNFGRSWVHRWPGPLVATLHNFRPLCAAATFYRDGGVCTDCLRHRSAWPAVAHACYQDSRLRSLPVAVGTRFDRYPVFTRANRFIVLNDVMADMYVAAGVDRERLHVLPNFLAVSPEAGRGGQSWVYVGRLVAEKGILELLRNWPAERQLRIVGDGPLLREVKAVAGPNVAVLGRQPRDVVTRELANARGMVFPSRWLEGFPIVYLEALAVGTPVLAWRPSSVADIISREGTGLVVDEDLAEVLKRADEVFPALRRACKAVFRSTYTAEAWVSAASRVYADAMEAPDRLTG